MNNFDSAFKKVCELADDFKKNEQLYLSPKYSEAQVRQDFIDKFFESLGWDIYHKIQKNPYEQEVKVEKGVNVEKAHKRADYAFYISPEFRQPKFFTEAKKPSRSLKNAQDYFQTIRYAWSANTPVAVLTDFEELHILDCRLKPNINQVLQSPSHKCFRYTDYTDEEKFKEIYFLFSRDSVADGSLIKYSESLPKLKGKKVAKSVYQSIDDDFLGYIDGIRETLAKAFKKNDASLTSEELTEATQRTIDRLVFIRFLEDKQIEPDFIVSEFVKKENPFKSFISICRTLDAKYNGIVFKKHFIDEQDFHGPEQSVFKKICDEISHENSPYDFNAIPIHILGFIYERFLGKVVNATAQRVKVEEKPEVRKAGGVYYTPKYIVDYIVENTVGKILGNKNKEDALVTKPQLRNGMTPVQISALRFADIACGSGSFLIGVFETLLKYHTEYYQSHPDEAKKDGCINKDGQWVLSIKQKQKILVNNIYGVDIDPQAVEVTQLSLALKMLEDETTATANEMQALFHEKILPDLSKNIVCGNSIIGTDILDGKLFKGDAEDLTLQEERKLNPLDFETTFPHIFKKPNTSVIPAEAGIQSEHGFNAIVGNPPYVVIENKFRDDISLLYYKNIFKSASYKIDLYHLFIERGIKILKDYGIIGFITPSNYLSNNGLVNLRKYILEYTTIKEINIINGRVFSASVDCSISVFVKGNKNIKSKYIKSNWKENSLSPISYKLFNQEIFKNNEKSIFVSTEKTEFNVKCFGLSDFFNVNFGMQLRDRTKFEGDVIQNNQSKLITKFHRPCYIGKDINEYYTNYSNYLAFFNLKAKRGGCWDEYVHNYKPKILIRQIGKTPICTMDEKGYCCLNAMFMITPKKNEKVEYSLYYILGILNSKYLKNFWIKNFYDQRILFPKIKGGYLEKLPIPNINFRSESEKQSHDLIVSLVDQMLTAKKQLHESKTDRDKDYYERRCSDLDRQIDSEVYKLYDLTEDEIKIVEGK